MLVQSIADISSAVHDTDEPVTLCQRVENIFVKPVQTVLSLSKETIECTVIQDRLAYCFAKTHLLWSALPA